MFLFQATKTGAKATGADDLGVLRAIAGAEPKRAGFFVVSTGAMQYPGVSVMPEGESGSGAILSKMKYVEGRRLFVSASQLALAKDAEAASAADGSDAKKNALEDAVSCRHAAAMIANNFWEVMLGAYDSDAQVHKAWGGLAQGENGRAFFGPIADMREAAVGTYIGPFLKEIGVGLADYGKSLYTRAKDDFPLAFKLPLALVPLIPYETMGWEFAKDMTKIVVKSVTDDGKIKGIVPIGEESVMQGGKFTLDLFAPYISSRGVYQSALDNAWQLRTPDSVEKLAKQFISTSVDAIFTMTVVFGFVESAAEKIGLNLARFAAIDARAAQLIDAGKSVEKAMQAAKYEVDGAIAGKSFSSGDDLTSFLNKKFKMDVKAPQVKDFSQVIKDATEELAMKRYGDASAKSLEKAGEEIKRLLLKQAGKNGRLKPADLRGYLEDEINKMPLPVKKAPAVPISALNRQARAAGNEGKLTMQDLQGQMGKDAAIAPKAPVAKPMAAKAKPEAPGAPVKKAKAAPFAKKKKIGAAEPARVDVDAATMKKFLADKAGYYADIIASGMNKAKTATYRGVGTAGIYIYNGAAYLPKDVINAFGDAVGYFRLNAGKKYVASMTDLKAQALLLAGKLPDKATAVKEVNALFANVDRELAAKAADGFGKISHTPLTTEGKPLSAMAREMLELRASELAMGGMAPENAMKQAVEEVRAIFTSARGAVVDDVEKSMQGMLRDPAFSFTTGDKAINELNESLRSYSKSADFARMKEGLPTMPVGKATSKEAMDDIAKEWKEVKAGWWAGTVDIASALKPAAFNDMFNTTSVKISQRKEKFIAKYQKSLGNADKILKGEGVDEGVVSKIRKSKQSRLSPDLQAKLTKDYNELTMLFESRASALKEGREAQSELNMLTKNAASSENAQKISAARNKAEAATARIEAFNKQIDAKIGQMDNAVVSEAEATAHAKLISEVKTANSYQGGIALLDDAAEGVNFSRDLVKSYASSQLFSYIRARTGGVKLRNVAFPFSADYKAERQVISELTKNVDGVQKEYESWLGLQTAIEGDEEKLSKVERSLADAERRQSARGTIRNVRGQRITEPGTVAAEVDRLKAEKLLLEKQIFGRRMTQAGACAKTAGYWAGLGAAGTVAIDMGATGLAQFAGAYGVWAIYATTPGMEWVPLVSLPLQAAKNNREEFTPQTSAGKVLKVADKALSANSYLNSEEKSILSGIISQSGAGITATVSGHPLSLKDAFENALGALSNGARSDTADAVNSQRILAHLNGMMLTAPSKDMVVELNNIAQGNSSVPPLRPIGKGAAPAQKQTVQQFPIQVGGTLDVALPEKAFVKLVIPAGQPYAGEHWFGPGTGGLIAPVAKDSAQQLARLRSEFDTEGTFTYSLYRNINDSVPIGSVIVKCSKAK